MSLKNLHKRYQDIAKKSLSFLKYEGFQKKGSRYFKQRGDFILKIYPEVPRAHLNDDHRYAFDISWDIETSDSHCVEIYRFLSGQKNASTAFLMGTNIIPKNLNGHWDLTDADSSTFDQQYIDGIQQEVKRFLLPTFEQIHSMDDIIRLTEEDAQRTGRLFFPGSIYDRLARFYTFKGLRNKALEAIDKDIEETPVTARRLAEKDKKKLMDYFEMQNK